MSTPKSPIMIGNPSVGLLTTAKPRNKPRWEPSNLAGTKLDIKMSNSQVLTKPKHDLKNGETSGVITCHAVRSSRRLLCLLYLSRPRCAFSRTFYSHQPVTGGASHLTRAWLEDASYRKWREHAFPEHLIKPKRASPAGSMRSCLCNEVNSELHRHTKQIHLHYYCAIRTFLCLGRTRSRQPLCVWTSLP